MRVAVIHPLKHHVYYSMAGVMESGAEVIGLFGYYDKNDFLDKIVRKTKWKKQIDGYKYEKISKCVKTNLFVKALFLLSKARPKQFQKLYNWAFEIWVIHNLKGVDCIHVLQDYGNNVIRTAKKRNIKIVYEQIIAYYMERYFDNKSVKEDLSQRENLHIVDYILTASDFVKNSILEIEENRNVESKITVIPYGANTQQFSYKERAYEADRELRLLVVASISKRKGINYLLDAMEILQDYPVKLTVIGVPVNSEHSLINRIQNMNNVEYIGRVPHEQIHNYYKQNDVFVLPSLAEGSSLSVYEALASGMPCVVTKNTGSVITEGMDGFIIEVKSAESIVAAIGKYIENPELIHKMSLEAKNTIDKYTWEEYEKMISDFFKKKIIQIGE
ncbi:glycosyltransferase family 4 protein [Enterococcus cecorum]|uniref:glycosyltransferase family 4 protein n=1 Tax=Enterococcus cecorum TaxID=44008 RepID=UPI0032C49C24